MDLRQLRYFSKVVECGSFSKAALQLHVAQPSLSLHLRNMEQELGVQLLTRSARGVATTEAGDRLLDHAQRIITEFATLAEAVRDDTRAPSGEVRIAMPGTVVDMLAAPLIEAARLRFPDVRIRVVEAMSGYIRDWLRSGEVDLAVICNTHDCAGIAVHDAISEEICLFANPSYANKALLEHDTINLLDALRWPLVVTGAKHALRELIDDAARSVQMAIEPAIEIDSYGQIKKLVMRGLGYGILPRASIQREAQAGLVHVWQIESPTVKRMLYLAHSTERQLPLGARAIGQLAWDVLRDQVRDDAWIGEIVANGHRPDLYPAQAAAEARQPHH